MATVHQSTFGDFDDFKQKKRQQVDKKVSEDLKPVLPDATLTDQAKEDIQFLKAFDLDYAYGPSIGLSRSERWERANKLGLKPDQGVKQLIQQHPNDPLYTQCLWKGTLVSQ